MPKDSEVTGHRVKFVTERTRPPTPACRCYGCGNDEPMGCGRPCPDCSWEDHLSGVAHTGDRAETWETHEATPVCCRESRERTRS